MQDNANYSYISTVVTPDETTHYIKDAEARDAITGLETSKQDKIDSSHKLPASNISGLATVATTGSYNDLTNKPTIPPQITVDTAMSDSSVNAVQNKVIKTYVDTQISGLGSVLNYKGTKTSESAIKGITSAKAGDVWINTADNSEWVCKENISAAKASAWEKLGPTIDLSGYAKTADLGTLAFKNSASGSFTPSGSVTVDSYTPEGSIAIDSYTPAGNISMNNFTPAGSISVGTGTNNYTPAGSVSINAFTPAGTISKGTGTANYTPEGTITLNNYTPEGTISAPTITVTPNTTTVNSITAVGTLPSLEATVANETLSISFNPGTLPTKGSNTTVATGIKTATATAPTFSGTAKAPSGTFNGTGAELKFTGTQVTPTGSFTGTGTNLKFTGTAAKPTGSFTGTAKAPTGSFTGTAKAPTGSFTGTAGTVTVS